MHIIDKTSLVGQQAQSFVHLSQLVPEFLHVFTCLEAVLVVRREDV